MAKEINKEEEAKAVLLREQAERSKKCTEEITPILEKYNCVLIGEAVLRNDFVKVNVHLVSK